VVTSSSSLPPLLIRLRKRSLPRKIVLDGGGLVVSAAADSSCFSCARLRFRLKRERLRNSLKRLLALLELLRGLSEVDVVETGLKKGEKMR